MGLSLSQGLREMGDGCVGHPGICERMHEGLPVGKGECLANDTGSFALHSVNMFGTL